MTYVALLGALAPQYPAMARLVLVELSALLATKLTLFFDNAIAKYSLFYLPFMLLAMSLGPRLPLEYLALLPLRFIL